MGIENGGACHHRRRNLPPPPRFVGLNAVTGCFVCAAAGVTVASQLPRNGPESPNAMRERRNARRSAVPCATRSAHFRKNVSSLIVTPSHFAPYPARNGTYEDNKQNHRAQKQCTMSSLKACWRPTIAWFVGCCQRESVCCRRPHAGFRHARDQAPTSVLLHHDSPL